MKRREFMKCAAALGATNYTFYVFYTAKSGNLDAR